MANMLLFGENKVRNGKLKNGISKIDGVEPCPLLRQEREMATMSLTFAVPAPSLSLPSPSTLTKLHNRVLHVKPLHCTPTHQHVDADTGIMCEPCNGKGWLVCDFCKGQKTNIKAENKRIYRRCPSCKAVGYVLCSNCKVFKCVTFPNFNDSES
ncbi:unnamed protein product [Sphenostylis stenocarpa]|uniref:Uncharacterized protein n=1 Tax=Sphenostylis stenocarpa TaxID=92480 RepID=A0AA86T3Q2_9FABA|nr:unnamed protein product [Sphenostylis stenocarpa]